MRTMILCGRSRVVLLAAGALLLGLAAPARAQAAGRTAPGGRGPGAPSSLAAFVAGRPGSVTVYVHDEVTGRDLIVRSGTRMVTASIIKASVLAQLLRERHGRLSAREQALATRMITESDNSATDALWADIGGAAADGALDSHLGMSSTTPGQGGYWGLTTTTARDQVELLLALRGGALLARPSADYQLGLMRTVDPAQAWGVSGGLPSGVTVALKNGWLPLGDGWHVNSIGLVSGRGHDYAIAVLTSGQPSEGAGIATIEGVSALAWGLTSAAGATHRGRDLTLSG